jgi:hypothetical protein
MASLMPFLSNKIASFFPFPFSIPGVPLQHYIFGREKDSIGSDFSRFGGYSLPVTDKAYRYDDPDEFSHNPRVKRVLLSLGGFYQKSYTESL